MKTNKISRVSFSLLATLLAVSCVADPSLDEGVAGSDVQQGDEEGQAPFGYVGVDIGDVETAGVDSLRYWIRQNGQLVLEGKAGVRNGAFDLDLMRLPEGEGYELELLASGTGAPTQCPGKVTFDVLAGSVTKVAVELLCKEDDSQGDVEVDGALKFCPRIESRVATPSTALLGDKIKLTGSANDRDNDPLSYRWTVGNNILSKEAVAYFTCVRAGTFEAKFVVDDGTCADQATIRVACKEAPKDEGTTTGGAPGTTTTGGAPGTTTGGAPGTTTTGGAPGTTTGGAPGTTTGGSPDTGDGTGTGDDTGTQPDDGGFTPAVLFESPDRILHVFAGKYRIWVVTTKSIEAFDLNGNRLTRHVSDSEIGAAHIEDSRLVFSNKTHVGEITGLLKYKQLAKLSAPCASGVLLSNNRWVCGTSNDWNRSFFVFDLNNGELIGETERVIGRGIPMRAVPGRDAFITYTSVERTKAFHLSNVTEDGKVVFSKATPVRSNFSVDGNFSFLGQPVGFLVDSIGNLLKMSAKDCPATFGETINECLRPAGKFSPQAQGEAFWGVAAGKGNRVFTLLGEGVSPVVRLQQWDAARNTLISQYRADMGGQPLELVYVGQGTDLVASVQKQVNGKTSYAVVTLPARL